MLQLFSEYTLSLFPILTLNDLQQTFKISMAILVDSNAMFIAL